MATIAERFAYFKRLLAQAIVTPIVILLLLVGLLCWQIDQLVRAALWVDHSDQVIAQANLTLQYALDAETGLRGYLVSRRPLYLQPYQFAQTAVGPAFDKLERNVADNTAQAHLVRQMEAGYISWLSVAQKERALRDAGDPRFFAFYSVAPGKQKMDALRGQFAQFIVREEELKSEREAAVRRSTRGVLASAIFLALAGGIVLGAMSARRLIVVAHEYEKALSAAQQAGEMLGTTLLSIGDAVLVTDQSGRVTMLNSVAERLTGWSAKDAIGKKAGEVFVIVNEATRETVESPIDRVIREGVVVGLANHTVLIRPDGGEIPIDDSGAPIRDDKGKLVGVVLVFRDITERKQAEKLLAHAYEKEHRIAEALQDSLLSRPALDAFPHLETETLYRAAHHEARVGGDYFDLFLMNENKIALVVGDVSGKGLNAAVRTAEMKYALRGFLREHPDAATGLRRLNSFICESQELEKEQQLFFLCLTVAVIEPLEGKADVCVAGAEPPLIVRTDGTVNAIPVSGMPLGVDASAEYDGYEVEIAESDIFLVATDGITEARRGKELLGFEGFTRLVKQCGPNGSLKSIGSCVLERAEEFAHGNFTDDVCLLLARVK